MLVFTLFLRFELVGHDLLYLPFMENTSIEKVRLYSRLAADRKNKALA